VFVAPRIPPGILARMQPGPVRDAPNAPISAELAAFNLAVNAQPDTPAKISFVLFYLQPPRTVKEAAFAQSVTRDTFYRRAHRFRRLRLQLHSLSGLEGRPRSPSRVDAFCLHRPEKQKAQSRGLG
jgi:hypothetical protein